MARSTSWKEYNQRYHHLLAALGQARTISTLCEEILVEFPRRLPENLKKRLGMHFKELREQLSQALAEMESGEQGTMDAPTETSKAGQQKTGKTGGTLSTDEFLLASTLTIIGDTFSNRSIKDMDFIEAVASQHLVMVFAHLEAFIGDTLRVICRLRPEVLKSNKKIDWETLINLGGWDDVLDHIIEQYVFDSGWTSISENVQNMRDNLGLPLNVSSEIVTRLQEADYLRNIIVHNGGRANARYLKQTGRADVQIGAHVSVSKDFVRRVSMDALILAGELCTDVGVVHFKKDRSTITAIFRARGPEDV